MRHSPLLLAALVIPLAGCGGGTQDVADGPSPVPSSTMSTPATPAPSATIATPPAHETAEQFIRRWVRVNTEAQRTGDLTALNELNEPNCESCKSFAKAVTRIYRAGGEIQASDTEVLAVAKHLDGLYYSRERSAPSRYRDSATSPWKTLSGGTSTEVYTLAKKRGQWRMSDYSGLAGSAE